MATVTATCSPSSLQLRLAFNCGNCVKPSSVLVRRRLGKLDQRARVLCVAQGNERSGAELEPRRNGGSGVGSNSNADGFKGWSGSDNGEESLDSQRKKWFGGTVGAGVAGVVLVAGLTFAALSLGKRKNLSPKQQMEPLTTQHERSLTYDDENHRSAEDVDDQSNVKNDASSSPEGRTGTNEDSSSSPEIDESPSEIRVDNDYDIGGLSAQDFKNTSGGTEANAINNGSDKGDSPLESTSDDKSVEPETFTRKFDLSESDNGNDSFVATEIEGFDSSLAVGIGDLASELKGNLVSVEPTNLQASDSNLSTEPQDGIPGRSENHISTFKSSSLSAVAHEHNEPVALDVSLTSQSNTILEPQVSSEDNIGTVPSSSTQENLEMSKTLQVLAEGISSSLEKNTIIESELSRNKSQLPNAGNSFSSAGIPAPTVGSAALQVPPGKVLVPAIVDQVQGQAFAALQVLKVIEADVQPGDLCTRREYARWLVSASSALSRNSISKVYPSMYIENVTELAFDDITSEDPDFPSIQGLAEAGLISSKLSRKDMRSSMDEDESPFYFFPESPLSRQDLVSWKMALEKRYLPKADKEVLYRISGFIDADKIHPDACPALVADLSGEQGIIALAFAAGPQGSGYRDTLIDGFTPPSTSVAPMFPFYENSTEWDDFGEVINPDDYVIKDEDMDHGAMHVGGDMDGKLDEGSASLILDTRPSKVVSTELTVQVKCSLIYMDFEGRSDARSIKSILSHMAPLKLVLVHGTAEATEHLKQHCLKHVCPHVYAPQIEETIDVTSDLCAYKVQLSEKLMSNVLFKKVGDYEIAWVDSEAGKTENDMLSLQPLSNPPPPHESVLVGDLKMANFKQFLSDKGVQAEFAGGVLRCGEYVTLRKVGDASHKGGGSGTQQIVIEGPLCEDYYKIREYLYSQFYLL